MSLSKLVVGRLAASLYLIVGAVTIVGVALPSSGAVHRDGLATVAILALLIGLAAWLAPWERWGRGATLWLVPGALALNVLRDVLGGSDAYSYGISYVVLFAWIGVGHKPLTSVKWAPLAAVAYALPLIAPGHPETAVASTLQVVPLAVLLGEALSRIPSQLRRAEAIDSRRMVAMRALVKATEVLARQEDAGAAADVVARLGAHLLGAEAALVLVSDNGTLSPGGSYNWPRRPDAIRIPEIEKVALIEVIEQGVPVLSPERSLTSWAAGTNTYSTLFIPLHGAAGPLGVVAVAFQNEVTALDPFEAYVGQTFATQAGLAFERLQTTHVLLEASMRDELTGLGNRRSSDLAIRQLRPGDSVVLLDLDNLKKINDTKGHGAGDEALRQFGAFLQKVLREQDRATRYGGDEFLLVLRGADGHGHATIERLAEAWRRTNPITTFTAGVAEHFPGTSATDAVVRADRALYKAKRKGRNRVAADRRQPVSV